MRMRGRIGALSACALLSQGALVLALPVGAGAAETSVCSNGDLQSAVDRAQPGDKIKLCAGTWKDTRVSIKAKGRKDAPVTIAAAAPGETKLTGNVRFELGGAFIVIDGLVFTGKYTGGAKEVIDFRSDGDDCSDCRVTNVVFDGFNSSKSGFEYAWITVRGKRPRVDHSHFSNRTGEGRMVQLIRTSDLRNDARFDHNYFGERPEDGGTSLALGTSGKYAASVSGSIVENNYFYDLHGSGETIVNKSSGNYFRGNTIEGSRGGLSIRQGNGVVVEGNFFLGRRVQTSAGVKVLGEDHVIINNYFADLDPGEDYGAGGIKLGRGSTEIDDEYGWVVRPAVRNITIAFNTIVNTGHSISIGTGEGDVTPSGLRIANNIVLDPVGPVFRLEAPLRSDTVLASNIYYGGKLGLDRAGFQEINPRLIRDQWGIFRPTSGSPVFDAAVKVVGVSMGTDIDAQLRKEPFDIGADEYAVGPTSLPLTLCDVGPQFKYKKPSDCSQQVTRVPKPPFGLSISH